MNHIFTHEQITAIRNLIMVAEEQYSEASSKLPILRGFSTSADDIIIQQSIDEMKNIIDEWDAGESPPVEDVLKISTEAYDRGYKSGANQKDNKPCVCGFWGDSK